MAATSFNQGWDVGGKCFVNDEEEGWVEASITKVAGLGRSATLTLRLIESGKTVTKEGGEVELAAKLSLEGVSDMTTLDDLTEATVLSTLRARYRRQEIYTNVGGILVAVNPYERLSDKTYGEESMFAYGGADVAFTGCEPHPYLLAESALRALDRDRESQSFVISGESGSGKTETCKYVLRYLSYRSKRRFEHSVSHAASDAKSNELEESVLLSNPILEAFGNAKTSRNDNSSRWGKYTQVYVQPSSGAIEKVGITAYLLEKVRVIERTSGERNYHVFYQFVAGLGSGSVKRGTFAKAVGTKPTDHAVLRDASGQVKAPKDALDVDAVKATQNAMKALAVDEASAFIALAAVVHLGDVTFVVSDTNDVQDSGAAVGTEDLSKVDGGPSALSAAASALGVDQKELEEALVSRRVASVRVPRSHSEAEVAKQAFAKALYSRLFEWVLRRVNHSLNDMTGNQPQKMTKAMLLGDENGREGEETLTIGLLDIFGFEAFVTNSIEQLLINYANERLLQEFNKQVFEAATKEYQAEEVDVGDLTYHDNSALLRMLENPRDGVFATLNSECVRRDGSDLNFLSTLLKRHGLSNGTASGPAKKNGSGEKQTVSGLFVPKVTRSSTQAERDSAGSVFGVAHFAADVVYNVNGFVEKNRDRLPDEICALVATSDQPSIAALFADVEDDENSQGSPRAASGSATSAGPKKKSTRYVAASFAESLTQLTQLLDATSQSFVRCIKPNHKMMARQFEGAIVLDQLRCMGMLELVEARRRGYARRIEHFTFVSRYALLLDDGTENAKNEEYSYSAALMSLLSGPSTPADVDNDVTHRWEAKGGSPAISREFISALKAKKAVPNPKSFEAALAVGKTKVFLKKDAVDQLESAREERLKRDVLLALGEATEARDAMQLELTLRIADELRLGETDEARLARSTLADERAFQDVYAAIVELCDEKKSDAVDVAFQAHSLPLVGDGDLSEARAPSKKKGSENLPFSSGQWFVGSQWSVYVHDVSRVARTARFGDRVLASIEDDVTPENLAAANKFVAAARVEIDKYSSRATNDEDVRSPPVDSLKRLADRAQRVASNAQKRMHVATALRGLRTSVGAKNLLGIKGALKTLDGLPSDQAETMMTDKDDDSITEARTLVKQLEALAVLDNDTSRLTKDTSSSSLTKKFAAKKDAPAQVATLEAEIAAVDKLSAAQHNPKLVENARALATKLSNLLAEKAPKKKAVAAAAAAATTTVAAGAVATAASVRAPVEEEATPTPEEIAVKERKLAREKRQKETKLAEEEAESNNKPTDTGPVVPSFSSEMQGLTKEEKRAIAAEEAKRVASGAVLFCDIPWSSRVEALRQGHRVLKMSATSSVQGADWKHVRLETPVNARGEPLLANDPTFRDSSIRSASFLTWPSHTLLRRGSRKLAISSITGVNVGTNAKQWCTMVPTEWHYMTLTTPDRTYDFGFENASIMLLWVNTLQRIIFPDWIRQCEAGEMSELFKGAISDAQHRFYRSARAGASASDLFKPSLPELCPVLYPIASRLESICAELGVSFASRAERSQKFCMWTAVAVLEAPVPRDSAVLAMRAVLSDLGFYAEGRFACSAGFYDENGLAHTLAKDAIATSAQAHHGRTPPPSGMLVIRAQHAKTGKVSVLKIKKGTKMASVFEAHAKHKGLRTQALSVVK